MFSFFLRKGVRKILKRKDSDAGEKGRALEDLRASLFNQFRSPEGAKRQQQRICGPAVALSFNFLVAVGIIFMNKMVLQTVKFKFPILLTLIHYVVSWFLMALLKAFSLLPASPSSKSTRLSTLFTLGFVMSLSTGFANVSLKYNSIGFYQMAKIAVTPSIVLAEFVLYRKNVSFPKALALTAVSIGVAVATVTDLQFHVFGACVALAWIVPSAVNKILWSRLQQQENWTALSLMWKTTPITLIFLAAMLPCLDPPGVLSFDWNLSNSMVIFASAILGFLLQWSGALALGLGGALSRTTQLLAFAIGCKKDYSVSRLMTWSYMKVHNNLLSRASMGDVNLIAKLNAFMEQMVVRQSALEEQMVNLSIAVEGVTKVSVAENLREQAMSTKEATKV
ncbi:Nucleotide-sugar uncharacterized transporter 1 [Mucuna pruriens]|uniref:Nucleotide-sugar uncharacterized transporter 1 n=1 Tax=Mucuna pruriens TaxID=157652 RepID=A0A371ER07_MUCPR|nr:Nucleotide-sugar uncharacterized transporter 1 [Mucuna pruriens]